MKEWLRTALVGLVLSTSGALVWAQQQSGGLAGVHQSADLFKRFFTWNSTSMTSSAAAPTIASSAASGDNAFQVNTAGARVDIGPSSSDYFYSQSGAIRTPASFIADGVSTFTDTSYVIDPNTGSRASLLTVTGIAVGGAITTETQGQGLILTGRRSAGDTSAGVTIQNSIWNDGGVLFQVNNAYPCNTALLTVEANALGFGAVTSRDCTSSADQWAGSFTDTSTLSGHVAMQSAPKYYLSVAGRLTDNHDGVLPDGGRPDAGAYPAGWVGVEADGGSYFTYAGFHGNLTVKIPEAYYGASLFEWFNPIGGGIFTDHVAGVSWLGGYWQAHGKTKAQFPSPEPDNILTNLGQYRHMVQSTMLFDFADTEGGHNWYYSYVDPIDAGASWRQFAHQAPQYGPSVYVNAALVSSTTLGGWQTPGSEALLLDALVVYIGTPGSGGSTNAKIRFDDNLGHACDFDFACNTATGSYRFTSAGDGCGPVRGVNYTVVVNNIGDCASGPVLKGNITPEFRWR